MVAYAPGTSPLATRTLSVNRAVESSNSLLLKRKPGPFLRMTSSKTLILGNCLLGKSFLRGVVERQWDECDGSDAQGDIGPGRRDRILGDNK